MVDEGDVEDAQSRFTAGGVKVLAAQLHALDVRLATRVSQAVADVTAGMLVRVFEFAVVLKMLGVVVGIHELMQRAADDGLRLITFGDDDRFESVFSRANPAVAAHEVEVVRPVHEQLRHQRVVVFVVREMAVGTLFRTVFAANRVRDVGRERDAAHAVGGDRLLLDVDRLAVVVVAADMDRTGRTCGADAIAGDGPVFGQHVDFVAQRLKVVRDIVAADVARVVQFGHLHVRSLRQMAAVTACVPGRVTGNATHLAAVVSTLRGVFGTCAPRDLVPIKADGLGEMRLLVVARMARCDRVEDLRDLPLTGLIAVFFDHRDLNDFLSFTTEAGLAGRGRQRFEIGSTFRSGRTARAERGSLVGSPVTVFASDLDRRADFAVQLRVAVRVLFEVAIDAVHPFLKMDIHEMHRDAVLRLAAVGMQHRVVELRGGLVFDDAIFVVEQSALAIFLEDRFEDPAVAVEVGELRVLEFRVEVGGLIEEFGIGPVPFGGGLVGIGYH